MSSDWHERADSAQDRIAQAATSPYIYSGFRIVFTHPVLMRRSSIILLFLASRAIGQILPFHYYSTETGLVSNGVTALLQDSKGYLWIGTGEGISVFDGTTFRNITAADGLPLNSITCLAERRAESGTIVVGTWGGGLSMFRNGKFISVMPDTTGDSRSVLEIQEDHQGNLWCLTSAGLYKGNGSSFTLEHDAGSVDDFTLGGDSLLWIVKANRVTAWTVAAGAKQFDLLLSSRGRTATIHRFKSGSLWVTTSDSMAFEIKEGRIISRRRTPFGMAYDMAGDARGDFWIAAKTGLYRYRQAQIREGTFSRYTKSNGLDTESVNRCLLDADNNLWVGGNGLFRLSDFNIFTLRIPDLSTGYNNSRALSDRRGHIWVVTGSGLLEVWREYPDSWRQKLHDVGIDRKGNSTPSIATDRHGHLWVDNGHHLQQFAIDTSLPHSRLLSKKQMRNGVDVPPIARFFCIVDKRDNIWINSLGNGVYRIRPDGTGPRIAHYRDMHGLPHNDIRAIHEDRSGNIWFGGVKGGVAMLPSGADSMAMRYTVHDGLPDDFIRGIAGDEQGRIWLATRRNGLAVLDSGRIAGITVKDGLSGAASWALALDDRNAIVWVGNQFGVQAVDMITLKPRPLRKALAQGPTTSLGIARDRIMWFLTDKGLTACDYGTTRGSVNPPRVHLTKFSVSGAERSLEREHEFSHSENNATFEFTAPVFDEPEAVQFRFRLEGLENEWRPLTAQRTATYAPLPPGEFTFEVVAVNGAGVSSQFPARISFTIIPPLYARWWFILFSGAVIVTVVWFMVRARIQRLLELERLRSRIARDLHDEIGSNLSSIAMASDLLRQRPGLGREEYRTLSDISATALDTVKDMRDMVWLMHPANDTLDSLLLRMKDVAASLLDGCEYTLQFPARVDARKLHLDWKRDVYLIYKEALTNIIKHAHATAVTIRVETGGERFILRVEDNGTGFHSGAAAVGNGLANMRHRADALGGSLLIESRSGNGTVIQLEVRIT